MLLIGCCSGEIFGGAGSTLLETAVDEAGRATNARAMWLMIEQYKLSSHLLAFKKYLLLSQGDFIQHLLDKL
jgi:gamma-tubulin complex component 3